MTLQRPARPPCVQVHIVRLPPCATLTHCTDCLLAATARPVGTPVRGRVALLSVRATAAPAKPAASGSSKVDTSLTPKKLGFTMPGEH